jgi:hypothetical protein
MTVLVSIVPGCSAKNVVAFGITKAVEDNAIDPGFAFGQLEVRPRRHLLAFEHVPVQLDGRF